MLDVLNADYVRTARAKGVPQRQVIMKHAFRNALIPFVTVAVLDTAFLIGGVIITEKIFAISGHGQGVPRRAARPATRRSCSRGSSSARSR